jgi:hypothetical protein
MKKSLPLLALVGAVGFAAAASARAENAAEDAQAFQSAAINMQAASDIATKEVAGMLSGIAFSMENGQAIYEATVFTTAGTAHIVKINADTGAVLMSADQAFVDDDDVDVEHSEADDSSESEDDGDEEENSDASDNDNT